MRKRCVFSQLKILLLMGFIAVVPAADTFSGYDVNLVTNAVVLVAGSCQ